MNRYWSLVFALVLLSILIFSYVGFLNFKGRDDPHTLENSVSGNNKNEASESSTRPLDDDVTVETDPEEWAGEQEWAAFKLLAKAEKANGEQKKRLISDAIVAYRRALTVFTIDDYTKTYADIQHAMGDALRELSFDTDTEQSGRLKAEAVTAYRNALKVYTWDAYRWAWEISSVYLGATLREMSETAADEQAKTLLAEAEAIFRNILKLCTGDKCFITRGSVQINLGNVLHNQTQYADGKQRENLYAKALAAYHKALDEYTQEKDPDWWATIQDDIALLLRDQSDTVSDEQQGRRLLKKAINAHKNSLKVYTRDQNPDMWATVNYRLGSALKEQGSRTEGEQGIKSLSEAVKAYGNYLKIHTREQDPQSWGAVHYYMGIALEEQGTRTDGKQGEKLLIEAVNAYKNSLLMLTDDKFVSQWEDTKSKLGQVYCLLKEWQKAVACYAEILKTIPDSKESSEQLSYIYHEKLFEFEKAYQIDERLIKALGVEDPNKAMEFIEKQFATSRFENMAAEISKLRPTFKNDNPKLYTLLMAFDIAGCRARDKKTAEKLKALIRWVGMQNKDFKLGWFFDGTKHFVQSSPNFSDENRRWLISLFSALAEKKRDEILKKLRPLILSEIDERESA